MDNSLDNITQADRIEFGKRLKKLLLDREMSQTELADKLGIQRQSVYGWCAGKNFPRINYIEKISNIMNVPKSVLLGWSTPEEHKIAVRAESFGIMLLYYTKMQKLSDKNQKLVYQLIDTLLEGEMHSEES